MLVNMEVSSAKTEHIDEIKTWDELNLKNGLLRGIYANGFENPSEIQKKAILPIINKNDVIAQANPVQVKREHLRLVHCKLLTYLLTNCNH